MSRLYMIQTLFSHKTNSPLKNFFILLTFLLINFLSVWFLGTIPLVALIPILGSGLLMLLASKSMKLFIVYVVFALAGTIQEILFISLGVWSYSATSFLSVPLYLPFIWGNISILCVSLYKGIFMLRAFRSLPHHPPKALTIFSALAFAIIFTLLSIYLFWDQPFLLFLLFIVIDIFLIFSIRSIPFALVGIGALVCGSVGDIVSVHLNYWSYSTSHHALLDVPLYIFLGWDIVGLFIVASYIFLETLEKEIRFK